MNDLDTGRLVWLSDVINPQGDHVGPHAAIILTPKEEQVAGQPIRVVVCSSNLTISPGDEMIMMPWRRGPRGHPVTGFNKPTAAICSWLVDAALDKITRVEKPMPGKRLLDIAACIAHVEAKRQKQQASKGSTQS